MLIFQIFDKTTAQRQKRRFKNAFVNPQMRVNSQFCNFAVFMTNMNATNMIPQIPTHLRQLPKIRLQSIASSKKRNIERQLPHHPFQPLRYIFNDLINTFFYNFYIKRRLWENSFWSSDKKYGTTSVEKLIGGLFLSCNFQLTDAGVKMEDGDLFLQQLHNNMQQCLKRFVQRPSVQKWTTQEKDQLKKIVKRLKPQQSNDWRLVCVEMHELGFRKQLREYRNQGINYLSNGQRLQIKLTPQKIDQIIENFELGNSVKSLTKIYNSLNIDSQKIRKILSQKFDFINTTIRRIVGISRIRTISVQDYDFFTFIRSKENGFPSLSQVAVRCQTYKAQHKLKPAERSPDFQAIEHFLEDYNTILRRYTDMFSQYKKAQAQKKRSSKSIEKKPRIYKDQCETVPMRHLASIAETLTTNSTQQYSCNESLNYSYCEMKPLDMEEYPTRPDFDQSNKEWEFLTPKPSLDMFNYCSIEAQLQYGDDNEFGKYNQIQYFNTSEG